MNKKKIVTAVMALTLSLSIVGCSNRNAKTPAGENVAQNEVGLRNTVADTNYGNYYKGQYKNYLSNLDNDTVFTTYENRMNAYTDANYPGNEAYLNDTKTAYKESRTKLQNFVNSLKNDVKTDDKELKGEHEKLITASEDLLKDMDTKISNLDKITKKDYDKSRTDFMKMVNPMTEKGDGFINNFRTRVDGMNSRFINE